MRGRLYAQLIPPPPLQLSRWAEANIVLPSEQSARPGAYRNWPYMVEILDAISSREIEYVTMIKASRVGYTKGLMMAIGAVASTQPCSIGLLVPVDEDARDYVCDELEPLFASTPKLRGQMIEGQNRGRTTLTRKQFKSGATLKVLSARAPRRLRRHDFKVLYCDEIDAMEITNEGDPLAIAEKRTLAHADRKIVRGSTPTEEDISLVERAYKESDQRIYEVPCLHCQQRFEILWEHIQWPQDEPEKAKCYCPHCGGEIAERHKAQLVEQGQWRAQRPEIVRHRGYRLSTLVSLLPNASWGKLAAEFLQAKRGGPAELQVFTNLVLAKPWRTSINRLSADALAGRVEPIGLERIPPEIVLLTAGADVQDSRIEVCLLGWPLVGAPAVLAHVIIDGNTLQDATWTAFDELLQTRWPHPHGWSLRVDAAAVDSGGHEGRTQKVYDFCSARLHRRVYAIRGVGGARPIWARAKRIKSGKSARLFIVGHDQVKTAVLELLSQEAFVGTERNPHALRVSDELEPEWFDQVCGEVRRIRYVRNRPIIEFVPKRRGQQVEALDALCYAWAVRQAPAVKAIDLRARAARREQSSQTEISIAARAGSWAARFNE
jgi:phage terminase large subunit GpA-like protein